MLSKSHPNAPSRWLTACNPTLRTEVRWGWILAIALGWILGLLVATWLGETGARLGAPDQFDLAGTINR